MVSILLLAALDPALAATIETRDYNSLQLALDQVGNNDELIINGRLNPGGGDPLPMAAEGTVTAPSRNFTIISGEPDFGVEEWNWSGSTIFVPSGADVTVQDVLFTCAHTPTSSVPAITADDATVQLDGSTFECFTNNVMTFTNDANVQSATGATTSTFDSNLGVFSGTGGGDANLENMVFGYNGSTSAEFGRAANSFVGFDSVTIRDAVFEGHFGVGSNGAAVYIGDTDSITIENCAFRYNYNLAILFDDDQKANGGGSSAGFVQGTGRGAGVYIDGKIDSSGEMVSEVLLHSNDFDGNFSWEGGGLYMSNVRYANLYNNLFAANWVYHVGGGMMSRIDEGTEPWGGTYEWPAENPSLLPYDVFGYEFKVVNNTFVLNSAGLTINPEEVVVVGGGGGAVFHGHRPDFRNNLVSHQYYGGGILLHDGVNFTQGDDLNWEYNMFYWNCDTYQCEEDAFDDHHDITSNGEESGYALHPNNILDTNPLFYYVGDIRDAVIDFDGYPDVFCTDFDSLAVRNGDPLEQQQSSIEQGGDIYSDIGMCGGQVAHVYRNADLDGDGFEQYYDCLDEPDQPEATETFPGAQEDCDFEDNDCDGTIDEGFVTTWYNDLDGDGYGDDENTVPELLCPGQQAADQVSVGGDCDDTNPDANEGETEICDGIDNDCDGVADQGDLEYFTVYRDADGDTFGAISAPREACRNSSSGIYYEAVSTDSIQLVGSNWVENAQDCDDSDPTVNPNAAEDCTVADRNCNGDSYDADSAPEYFIDLDLDGYGEGAPNTGVHACEPDQLDELSEGAWVPQGGDCDEASPEVNPGADESCDGLDNDCDGRIDVDPVDAPLLYEDYDNDGLGNPATALRSCDPGPTYTTAEGGDCDDSDPNVGECAECGCQATPSPASSGALLMLMAGLLGLRRRRSA